MCDAAVESIAVGFFDGVHRGHQAILSGADGCVTFANHPLSVLAPERAPRLIMSLEDRIEAIRACGIGSVRVLPFDRALLNLSPEEFAAQYLNCREVRCGGDWKFGRNGAGNAAVLERLGRRVVVVPDVEFEGSRISSSRIRASIERGEISVANAMLGRCLTVRGKVFTGKGLGRKIGFPTVNLALQDVQLRMLRGVYLVEVDGFRAIANYGTAPTLSASAWREPALELHFLEELPALAESIRVNLLRFIRPERKFPDVSALKCQIAEDIRTAQA